MKIYLFGLSKIYKFDPWHASAPYACRQYKREVVDLINEVDSTFAIEVGCGLADILSRAKSLEKYGVDADRGVVNACKKIYGRRIKFLNNNLTDLAKGVVEIRPSNLNRGVLIIINWPHSEHIDILRTNIFQIKNRIPFEYLVMDGIRRGVDGYKYSHEIDAVSTIGKIIKVVPSSDNVRDLYLVKVDSNILL